MEILVLDYKDLWHHESGGAQTFIKHVTDEFILSGHGVTIFTCKSNRAKEEIYGKKKYIRRGSKFTVFRKANTYLRHNASKFDLVIDTVNQRPFMAHKWSKDKTISLVMHIGSEIWFQEFSFPFNYVGKHILEPRWMKELANSVNVAAISDSTSESLAPYGIRVKKIIPPGVIGEEITHKRTQNKNIKIIFLARLVNNKRPFDAIKAFQILQESNSNISIDILGSGYLLEKIKQFSSENINVWGYVSDEIKNELLSNADFLISTSIREGWGMNVTEAALLGTPTIAYNVPGLRDSVIDGVTGLLVDETPEDIARGVQSLINNPSQWEYLSAGAASNAATWRWNNTADSILKIIEK